MENDRLRGRLVDRHHRILRSETVPIVNGDTEAAFLEICRRFDIQRPIQLRKHAHEYENFNTTFYTQEHFTEPISFFRLEIERISAHGPSQTRTRLPIEDA